MRRDEASDGVDYAGSFEFFCKNSQMYYYSYDNPSCDGEPVNNKQYEWTGDYNCDGASSGCDVIARYTADCDYFIQIDYVVQDICTPDGYKVVCTDDDEGVIQEYLNDDCEGDPYEALPYANAYDHCSASWECDKSEIYEDINTDTDTDGGGDDDTDASDTNVDDDAFLNLSETDEGLTDGEVAAIVIVIIVFVFVLTVILYRRYRNNVMQTAEDTDIKNEGVRSIAKEWVVLYTNEGKEYYQNNITKETTWNKPDGVDVNENDDPLPSGWSKLCTPDGKVYYQNNTTKATQWAPPS